MMACQKLHMFHRHQELVRNAAIAYAVLSWTPVVLALSAGEGVTKRLGPQRLVVVELGKMGIYSDVT